MCDRTGRVLWQWRFLCRTRFHSVHYLNWKQTQSASTFAFPSKSGFQDGLLFLQFLLLNLKGDDSLRICRVARRRSEINVRVGQDQTQNAVKALKSILESEYFSRRLQERVEKHVKTLFERNEISHLLFRCFSHASYRANVTCLRNFLSK